MAKRQARPPKTTRSAATGRKPTSGATKKAAARGRKQTAKRAKTAAGGRKRASKAQAKTKRTPQRATKRTVEKASRKTTRAVAKTARKATRAAAPRTRAVAPRKEEVKTRSTAIAQPTPAAPAATRGARAGREEIHERAARQRQPSRSTTVAPDAMPRGAAPAPEPRSRRARAQGGAPLPGVTPEMVGAHDEETPEEPLVPTPTSFDLDLRRTRKANVTLEERFDPDPRSALAIAAGDHDVSPESAEAVGDETPGGDNPTPDMDVVDLIGRSLGVEYEDTEELKGVDKITARDRKRWELDPASAEDFKDRNRS